MCKLGVISQERLKIEVKLLLSANRKSYMPHRLAQQWPWVTSNGRFTLSTLKSASSASHAISAVDELVCIRFRFFCIFLTFLLWIWLSVLLPSIAYVCKDSSLKWLVLCRYTAHSFNLFCLSFFVQLPFVKQVVFVCLVPFQLHFLHCLF